MSFSDYLENKLLDHLFDKAAYTAPTIYVGLSTADPADDASGLAEPSGGSYARVATVAGDWNAASAGVISNANAVTFPAPTGDWGTITHGVLFDAASAGNVLASAPLPVSQGVYSGDAAPSIAAGNITVTIT